MNRENQPPTKQIIITAILFARPDQAEGTDVLRGEALFFQVLSQIIPTFQGITELIFTRGFTTVTTLFQVASGRLTGGMLHQQLVKIFRGDVVDLKQSITLLALQFLFRGKALLFQLDTDPIGQPPNRIGESQPFDFHQKGEDIAPRLHSRNNEKTAARH